MSPLATLPAAPSEASALASEMAKAFGDRAKVYKRLYQISDTEARNRASQHDAKSMERARHGLPEQVGWADLDKLANRDEERALARWEEIKREALDELRTGHRAGRSIETYGAGPWERAQFFALRTELAAEWQPRTGMERQLLDVMAQAQASYLFWLGALTNRASSPSFADTKVKRDKSRWQPPRQTDADAMEQAAGMVDRFNRIFLRTLRTLRDLRRHGAPVIVQTGGQLNVGHQ
jgi:hypothetical protein